MEKEKICVNYQLISGPHEYINPTFYLSHNIGQEINQGDIYEEVFRPLSFRKDVDLSYLAKLLLQFKRVLVLEKNPLEQSFFSLLVSLFKRIKNINLVYVFFQFKAFADNIEVANYLVESAIVDKKIVDNMLLHYGLDILVRLKKYEEVFKIFVRNDFVE